MFRLLQEHLLDFDARFAPPFDARAWGAERKQEFLLRREVAQVLSTDGWVWTPLIDLGRKTYNSGDPMSQPRPVPVPSWVGANSSWENLAELEAFLAAHAGDCRESYWIVAITVHVTEEDMRDCDVGPYLEPTKPLNRDPSWRFLGFDVSDGSKLSGLCNCSFWAEEQVRLPPKWAPYLNDCHLFEDLKIAGAFMRFSDNRVLDHMPFFVYGLWLIEVRNPGEIPAAKSDFGAFGSRPPRGQFGPRSRRHLIARPYARFGLKYRTRYRKRALRRYAPLRLPPDLWGGPGWPHFFSRKY